MTEPLVQRVDGLAQWCQGFNARSVRGGAHRRRRGEIWTAAIPPRSWRTSPRWPRWRWARTRPTLEGEAAYAELVEYVRVSVQLVFEELTDGPAARLSLPAAH